MPTSGTGPFWSVILPTERTNLIVNPSFEFGTANWTTLGASALGSVSGTSVAGAWSLRINGQGAGSLGNDRGAVYGTANNLAPTGTYFLTAYVRTTGGSVALLAGTDNAVAGGTYAGVAGSFSDWVRLRTAGFQPSGGSVFPKIVAYGTAMTGTIYVDAVQLERGTVETTYIDGDQIDCSWDGLQHASTSKRGRDTRRGGHAVRLDDLGFTVDTSPGIGAPPFTTVSQSYAQLDGGEFQRQRKAERRFTLTSLVDGTSWADLHYQRRRLIEALRIENTPSQQPLRLLYSGAGGTVAIDAVWDGGVQFGADGQSFAEGIVASFTAYDPDWQDPLQQGTTLVDLNNLGPFASVSYRDPMGKWAYIAGSSVFRTTGVYAVAISPDGGTVYAGVTSMTMPDATVTRGLAYFSGTTWGTVGNGTINGVIYDLQWNFDNSKLLMAGSFATVGGTNTGQIAFWSPSTNTFGSAGFIGTGTSIQAGLAVTDAVAYSILPWSWGTYYIGGGPFHRINGVLSGTNWNLIQWTGNDVTLGPGTNTWSVVAPVSTNGTGFIQNNHWITSGSTPGVVRKLSRFDQYRIFIGAAANMLRGFGTGINTALYDIRGTWGTVPGLTSIVMTSAVSTSGAFRDQNRTTYVTAAGSGIVKIQGLTTSVISQSTDTFTVVAPDIDTVAWIGDTEESTINNVTVVGGVLRTNGYDYQPADAVFARQSGMGVAAYPVSTDIITATTGTTYFAFNSIGVGIDYAREGTVASLGTIVNNGMANVYPTLRLRNTSTIGTAVVRQWANMTTKEYAWFALALLPGETATLTTGPGRVAFQSSYRGDILSTVVGGSKLASWKLLPGQNIVSFLADTTDVVADMYWNPRHHSADGTGIV